MDWDKDNDVYLEPPLTHEVEVNVILPGVSRLPAGEYIAALAVVDPIGQKPELTFRSKQLSKGLFRNSILRFRKEVVSAVLRGGRMNYETDPKGE